MVKCLYDVRIALNTIFRTVILLNFYLYNFFKGKFYSYVFESKIDLFIDLNCHYIARF